MEADIIKTYQSVTKDILIGNQDIHFKTFTTGNSINFKFKINDFSSKLNFYASSEPIYLRAIGNLLKKNEFLQLYIQLIDNQITEEEYEEELDKNSDKYFVTLNPIESPAEYNILMGIVSKFPKQNLTMDDFSEIFGISSSPYLPDVHI